MAGGIFVDQPFHPNPKCIVFGSLLMIAYWFLPANKNIFMLPVIFVIAYIAMAWYDEMYNCNQTMLSGKYIGLNTFDAIFKPQKRSEKVSDNVKLLPDQEQAYLSRVYLFHVLAIVPILLYIGYKGAKSDNRAFPVLFTLGMLALIYHGTRIFIPRETSK